MKIVCAGGGPAGLYFAVLMKLSDPDHNVTVVERNPAGVTHGWGVVFWDDLVLALQETDAETASHLTALAWKWHDQVVDVEGQPVVTQPGTGYSIARQSLLDLLSERAESLGVQLQYSKQLDSSLTRPEVDLLVACDGRRSRFRSAHADTLGAASVPTANKHVWLGTSKVFDSFTFAFVQTAAGWLWCHAYGYSANRSTFIVECSTHTWRTLGLDRLTTDESVQLLQQLFARQLDGHPLMIEARDHRVMPWRTFSMVTSKSWHQGNTVLMGDAAHTTHFTIGSGTKLALQDAIALANALQRTHDVPTALDEYERERRAALVLPQKEALLSSRWFENVPRYISLDASQFAYLMHRRRSPILPHLPPRLYLHLRHTLEQNPAVRGLWDRLRAHQVPYPRRRAG